MADRYQTEALVIGVHNWGEADKIVTLFTRERGKTRAAAFGSRRPKSPLAAGMQMFRHVEVHILGGQRLDTVKQGVLLHPHRELGEDLATMAYGSFVAEIVQEFFPEGTADEGVFEMLLDVFSAFEARNPRVVALAAAWQILACTGMQLQLARCVHCGKELLDDAVLSMEEGGALCGDCRVPDARPLPESGRKFLLALIGMDWKHPDIIVRRENLLMAEGFLLAYLQGLMGKPLKSLAFIRQLGQEGG